MRLPGNVCLRQTAPLHEIAEVPSDVHAYMNANA